MTRAEEREMERGLARIGGFALLPVAVTVVTVFVATGYVIVCAVASLVVGHVMPTDVTGVVLTFWFGFGVCDVLRDARDA